MKLIIRNKIYDKLSKITLLVAALVLLTTRDISFDIVFTTIIKSLLLMVSIGLSLLGIIIYHVTKESKLAYLITGFLITISMDLLYLILFATLLFSDYLQNTEVRVIAFWALAINSLNFIYLSSLPLESCYRKRQ
jgi:hypothetical protein